MFNQHLAVIMKMADHETTQEAESFDYTFRFSLWESRNYYEYKMAINQMWNICNKCKQ